MSFLSATHSAPHVQPTSWAERVYGSTVRVVSALAREIKLRRDLRHVSEMNDHLLQDIGLARGGLETAVRFGRTGQRPESIPPQS